MLEGKILNLDIETMSHGAAGIATDPETGIKIFIENTCPEDKLTAQIYDHRSNMAYANVLEIDTESPHRELEPECGLHKVCGSCQWQQISYDKQLEYKRKNVIDLLKISKVDISALTNEIPSVIGMEKPWLYRNKVTYPVYTVPSTLRLQAGYYKTNSNDLINIKHCPIQYSKFDAIIERLKELCSDYQITDSILRHIQIRSNYDQSEILVTLIIRSQARQTQKRDKKSKKNKAIPQLSTHKQTLEDIKYIFKTIESEYKEIVGCTVNINNNSTNVILSKETNLISGKREYLIDTLGDIKVSISTTSFFQINNEQFCKIIQTLKEFAKDKIEAASNIIDAYCGIGSISLNLAKSFPQKNFIGFEINSEAVINAKQNIKLNAINNLKIQESDAKDFFVKYSEENKNNPNENFIILNPPRKGCTNKVLEDIAKLEITDIAYISCNPASLTRDIKYLEQYGYKLTKWQSVDMFPHTYHVETVCLISKVY